MVESRLAGTSIVDALAGKRIFLTGVTGFLGQVILERLLLDFPGTTITVLVRSQTSATAVERVHYLTRKPAFDVLRQRLGGDVQLMALLDERVTVIDGDFTRGEPELPSGIDVAIHSAFLAEIADEAVGLDGAQRPLRVAERRLEGRTNVRFSVGDAARLPFRDESFEGIWCIGALHHMPAWREAVAEASRVLRPGGTFRFLVYRRLALQTLVFAAGHALRPLAKRRLGSDKAVGRRTASIAEFTLLPVVHLFPEQTWLREVRTNGMQIQHVERRDAWFPLDRVIPGLATSDAFSDQLGRFLIVEARKAA